MVDISLAGGAAAVSSMISMSVSPLSLPPASSSHMRHVPWPSHVHPRIFLHHRQLPAPARAHVHVSLREGSAALGSSSSLLS